MENKIIYCGISAQGLPIISQLYDKTLLYNFHREINDENVELFASSISAKLATIIMNTQIRANTNIKEVHFNDLGDHGSKKIILCSPINEFSLDFIASGDFIRIKEIFKQLRKDISQEQILRNEFVGDLKPFRNLKTQLNEFLINNF